MAGLLSLPIELLQQIASFSTCSSVLNLLLVNHQLRNACHDRSVFQNIARRDLDHCPVGIYNNPLPWSESESILACGSLDELVRLAYVAEKGVEASFAKDNAWTFKISSRSITLEISNWLPHMLLLGHSAVIQMKPETFLEVQGRVHPHHRHMVLKKEFPTVNFIISYLLLSKLQHCVNPNTIKKPLDHFFENRSTDPPIPFFVGYGDGDSIHNLRQRVPNYGELKDDFDVNQATALLPALIVELATYQLPPIHLNWLPSPGKMPFASMLDIPGLYQDHASPPFSEWHIRKMVTADFIKGEWEGFYSDQRGAPGVRLFDPAMQDINIIAHAPSTETMRAERVAVIIERETRGVDAHGEFSLQGYVGESGLVRITKQYIVARWSWSWLGRMTPFGIVGVWGGGYDDFGGHFWIWKREWSDR